jgi:hypothetical protein
MDENIPDSDLTNRCKLTERKSNMALSKLKEEYDSKGIWESGQTRNPGFQTEKSHGD